jgi:hypothetical protein
MSDRNLNEINPKLVKDDRIILLHMDGEDVPVGSKGIVTGISDQPRQKSTDLGYRYDVKWYSGETGKPIPGYPILPEIDGWIFDRDYYENINESFYILKKDINK